MINSEAWSASFLLNVAHMTFYKLESQGFVLLVRLLHGLCIEMSKCTSTPLWEHGEDTLHTEEVRRGAEPRFHGSQSLKPGVMVGGGEVGVGLHSRQVHENRQVSVMCSTRHIDHGQGDPALTLLISSDQIRDITSRKQKKHQPRLF